MDDIVDDFEDFGDSFEDSKQSPANKGTKTNDKLQNEPSESNNEASQKGNNIISNSENIDKPIDSKEAINDIQSISENSGEQVVESNKDNDEGIEEAPYEFKVEDVQKVVCIGKGESYRAYLTKVMEGMTEKYYYLKEFKKSDLIKLDKIPQVLSEVNISLSTQHPNIIKTYYFWHDHKYLSLLQEYFSFPDLLTLLKTKRRLYSDLTKFYIVQIVLALQHLHKHNILYRFLIPENICLLQNGYIKLRNLILSKEIRDRTYTHCGIDNFMSPEVLLNKGYSFYHDYWMLGVLTYELLMGYNPFSGESFDELSKNIINLTFTIPSFVDPGPRSLINSLLKFNPVERLNGFHIRDHSWFKQLNRRMLDWDMLYKQNYKALYIPEKLDISNHDQYQIYEEEKMIIEPNLKKTELALFESFDIYDFRYIPDDEEGYEEGYEDDDSIDDIEGFDTIAPLINDVDGIQNNVVTNIINNNSP